MVAFLTAMTAEELQKEILPAQPDLSVLRRPGGFTVKGIFRVTDALGVLDEFAIEIALADSFPLTRPIVRETGGRIPNDASRHVYANHTLCYFVEEDYYLWLMRGRQNLRTFLEGPLYNYFLSQIAFVTTGKWPFGERPHGGFGRLDFYRDLFGVSTRAAAIPHLFRLLERKVKGHHACPCGSGEIIRRCHRNIILVQRYFPPKLFQVTADFAPQEIARLKVARQIRDAVRRAGISASDQPLNSVTTPSLSTFLNRWS